MTVRLPISTAMVIAALQLAASDLLSHPISLMAGQAVVAEDGVHVKIEVMVEDFMIFHGLKPDQNDRLPAADLQKAIEKHKLLLLRDFTIRDVKGSRLEGKITCVEGGDAIASEGVSVDDLMDVSVTYHLDYPVKSPPRTLTFQQAFGGDAPLPAVMELVVAREGLKLADTVNLTNDGNTETFDFDWDAAEETGKSLGELWRERHEKRRHERMGITSYSSIYGFIYILDHEVRIEVLVPLATLETWLQVPRVNGDFIEVTEQQAARPALEDFFCGKNTVRIDGIPVKPILRQLDFYGLSFRDFAMRPDAQRLSALTARAGAILSYSTKGVPTEVDISWEYFNDAVHSARTVVYAYDETLAHKFSPYRPRYMWRNADTRALPQITTVSVEGQRVDDDDGAAIVGALLKNVYRAFDYHGESDVYDALAQSVHGDLLADLYLNIYRGLVMQEQGGAVSRVKTVAVPDCKLTRSNRARFAAEVTWIVEGTVEHWGHIHTRENQYVAAFSVEAIKDAWKIVDMQVLNQKRLTYKVQVRTLK